MNADDDENYSFMIEIFIHRQHPGGFLIFFDTPSLRSADMRNKYAKKIINFKSSTKPKRKKLMPLKCDFLKAEKA